MTLDQPKTAASEVGSQRVPSLAVSHRIHDGGMEQSLPHLMV